MNPTFAQKLGFYIWKINVGVQKIDGSNLETFRIVIADLKIEDKASRSRFFQEIFLVADTKFEAILRMSFLKISNANMLFSKKTLTWKSYTINKALPITKRVQIVNPKEFIIAVLDVDNKTFVVYMVLQKQEKMPMHFKRQAQNKAQVEALIFDKAPTEAPAEYFDYSNVFLVENAADLLENTGINKHAIKLEKSKQPPFGPIYILGLVELKMLKTYIETNLANGFIPPSKSSASASILFN